MRDDERRLEVVPGSVPTTLDEVLDGITPPSMQARHGLHSPLYEALWNAHAVLVPHLDPPRRPDWRHVAGKLAARGITDGKGKAPTGERVRKAWWKVGRDKDAVAAGVTRRRRESPPPHAPAPPVAEPAPDPTGEKSQASPADAPDDFGFKFATDD